MGRRRKKRKPQIFSTSLLDMLFCAFGGMYTLFVIGSALFTTVSISLPVLITAQLDFSEIDTIEDESIGNYIENSYVTFGVNGDYKNETKADSSINVHYGYTGNNYSEEESRKTYLFLQDGIGNQNKEINLYAENLRLPLIKRLEKNANANISIKLELFIKGEQYINDTTNFQVAVKDLYKNQLPSNKTPIMNPLFNIHLTSEDDQFQFKRI